MRDITSQDNVSDKYWLVSDFVSMACSLFPPLLAASVCLGNRSLMYSVTIPVTFEVNDSSVHGFQAVYV